MTSSMPDFARREWTWSSADGLSVVYMRVNEPDGYWPAMVEIQDSDFSTLLEADCDELAIMLQEAAAVARQINRKRKRDGL